MQARPVRGRARTVAEGAAGPIHQQVPRCRGSDVIEHPDGIRYRVRRWWLVSSVWREIETAYEPGVRKVSRRANNTWSP